MTSTTDPDRYPYDIRCCTCGATYVAWLQPGHDRGERIRIAHRKQTQCGLEPHEVRAPLRGIAPEVSADV